METPSEVKNYVGFKDPMIFLWIVLTSKMISCGSSLTHKPYPRRFGPCKPLV